MKTFISKNGFLKLGNYQNERVGGILVTSDTNDTEKHQIFEREALARADNPITVNPSPWTILHLFFCGLTWLCSARSQRSSTENQGCSLMEKPAAAKRHYSASY